MQFHEKRRQQFLGERHFIEDMKASIEGIRHFSSNPSGVGDTMDEKWMWSRHTVANYEFQSLCLRYTAGDPIEPLRGALEKVIAEMLVARSSERQGRVIDRDAGASMEKKKQEGYF